MADQGSWVHISGEYPPKLVTNNPERILGKGDTPTCTGISPTAQGYMTTSSIPSVDTRLVRTYTVGANVYEWHYDRLWRFSASQVIYGAPNYTDVYLPQGTGYVDLNDIDGSTAPILKMLPFGSTAMAFMRSTGTHIMGNASSQSSYGFLSVDNIVQEATISSATHAVELDGDIYFVNTDGFYMLKSNGEIEDVGFDVSGSITPAALTADYNKKLIRIGDTHIYDVKFKKIFQYNGSTFVYETPELEIDNNNITVTDVEFHYDKTSEAYGEIEYYVQFERRGYGLKQELPLPPDSRGTEQSASMKVNPETGKTFQIKITSLPSNIKLTGIYVYLEDYTPESRDS